MSDDEIKVNGKILDNLLSAMKEKKIVAKVGVLGTKDARNAAFDEKDTGAISNATIGAAHEFGTSKLPQRSFLRMPLQTMLSKELLKNGFFTDENLREAAKEKNFKSYIEKIAITGVAVVLQAFDTGGFGEWPPSNMERKKVKQTLVETQQLRDSITYEVKE